MKRCPLCGTTFHPRVEFCFQDGTLLVEDAAALPTGPLEGFSEPISAVATRSAEIDPPDARLPAAVELPEPAQSAPRFHPHDAPMPAHLLPAGSPVAAIDVPEPRISGPAGAPTAVQAAGVHSAAGARSAPEPSEPASPSNAASNGAGTTDTAGALSGAGVLRSTGALGSPLSNPGVQNGGVQSGGVQSSGVLSSGVLSSPGVQSSPAASETPGVFSGYDAFGKEPGHTLIPQEELDAPVPLETQAIDLEDDPLTGPTENDLVIETGVASTMDFGVEFEAEPTEPLPPERPRGLILLVVGVVVSGLLMLGSIAALYISEQSGETPGPVENIEVAPAAAPTPPAPTPEPIAEPVEVLPDKPSTLQPLTPQHQPPQHQPQQGQPQQNQPQQGQPQQGQPPQGQPPQGQPPQHGKSPPREPPGSQHSKSPETTPTAPEVRPTTAPETAPSPWGANPDRSGRAQVQISSDPPGAIIFIGGKSVGVAPISTTLATGAHEVMAVLDGYQSAIRQIEVNSTTATVPFKLAPTATVGSVNLWPGSGELIGAEVYMNDTYLGTLPLTKALSEGNHTFRIVKASGLSFSQTKQVVFSGDGQPFTVTFEE